MLTREHYIGIYRVNGEVLLNTYPAIVPKPLFEEVRAKLAKNKKGSSSARNLFLLKGKIKCGYCGRSVNGESGTSQSGYSCYYYKFANRKLKVHRDLTFHHYNVRVRKTYFGLLTKIKKDTAHCSRSSTVSLLVRRDP